MMASSYALAPIQATVENHYSKQCKNLLLSLSGDKNYLFKKQNRYAATQNYRSIWSPVPRKDRRNFLVSANTSDLHDLHEVATPGITFNNDDYVDWDTDTKEHHKEGNSKTGASWVQTYIPRRTRPYANLMRLDKISAIPSVIDLPCLWAIALTAEAGTIPDVKIMAFFTLVMFITRGICNTINDYFDRDIDAKVERTKLRPLASGEVTPFQGLCFVSFQVLVCYGLLLHVNHLSRNLWLLSQVLLFTYPLMKRLTYWTQAYLGLAINSLPLCCWAAVKGGLNANILVPLCFSGFAWTLVYETIYSHQDKQADEKLGVRSPALLLGDSTKKWLTGFFVACIGGFAFTGHIASIGWPYYIFLAAASGHLAWHIWSVDLDSPADCFRKFRSNVYFGTIILCGILLGRLFQ